MALSFEEKTEKLKEKFKARTSKKFEPAVRHSCNVEVKGKTIWENIEETIQHYKKNGGRHLLDDIDNGKELFYYECPECGTGIDWKPLL